MPCHKKRLSCDEWQHLAEKHLQTARHWTVPCRRRRARGEKHPVYDFLFTYYPFSLGKLEQWHPGIGVLIEKTKVIPNIYRGRYYQESEDSIQLDPTRLREKDIQRLRWIHNLLKLTQERTPHYACHGMHEWAMVYSGANIRHRESAPLRFSQKETDRIVESRPIICSHFDAYRFFSPNALEFNKLNPTLLEREHNEQPGCLHTNMDLYKWASKSMPWVGSELLWKTFLLALKARELDMRASPYNLESYGYSPIKIETQEGRREYEQHQKELYQSTLPLRQQLIEKLATILAHSLNHQQTTA